MKTSGINEEMRKDIGYSGFIMSGQKSYHSLPIEDDSDAELKNLMVKTFGRNLKRLRTKRSLTQEQLGELAKVSYKYLGEIERGEKNCTARVLQKLSVALEVPICEILGARACPMDNDLFTELSRLFDGKKVQDQQKAVKLIRVFFE